MTEFKDTPHALNGFVPTERRQVHEVGGEGYIRDAIMDFLVRSLFHLKYTCKLSLS